MDIPLGPSEPLGLLSWLSGKKKLSNSHSLLQKSNPKGGGCLFNNHVPSLLLHTPPARHPVYSGARGVNFSSHVPSIERWEALSTLFTTPSQRVNTIDRSPLPVKASEAPPPFGSPKKNPNRRENGAGLHRGLEKVNFGQFQKKHKKKEGKMESGQFDKWPCGPLKNYQKG